MARSNEPAVWSLFTAGGVGTAFLFPALALILSGWFGSDFLRDYHAVGTMLAWSPAGVPVTKIILAVVVLLALFHALHRFRFFVYDLGCFHQSKELWAAFCYGLAGVLTAWIVYLLFFAERFSG